MKKQCVSNPDDLDWLEFWEEKLENKITKDWDKAAEGFYKRSKRDSYQEELLKRLKLSKDDTVIDVGCGEGSITIPIAKKVKSVTGLDSSKKMLEFLNKRASEEKIENIETILCDIEDISYDELGDYDVVVASRCLNGIVPIKETIRELNKIANKYVFFTVFGPDDRKLVKDFEASIGKDANSFPNYNYLFNILFNMGIYANIERLEIPNMHEYNSIEEIMNNRKFRTDAMSDEEKEKLRKYLEENTEINPETRKLYSPLDTTDWMLFWWKKSKKI